jgi:hypothetical protein
MTHFVAAELALAANITGTCHCRDPPYLKIRDKKQAYLTTRLPGLQGEKTSGKRAKAGFFSENT